MFVLVGSVLLAGFVVPAPWGQLLVGGALLWEIAEKLFLLRYSKRMPPVVGREALIGLPVTAVSPCLPEGWVKLRGERWKARCNEGAGAGDSLVVEAVEQITLVVAQPPSNPARCHREESTGVGAHLHAVRTPPTRTCSARAHTREVEKCIGHVISARTC